MTRSLRTAPVLGSRLSSPRNFWRAAIVSAGSGLESAAWTDADSENRMKRTAADTAALRMYFLLLSRRRLGCWSSTRVGKASQDAARSRRERARPAAAAGKRGGEAQRAY